MYQYVRPEAKVILFDNSDIITASVFPNVQCHGNGSAEDGIANYCTGQPGTFCINLGRDNKHNKCHESGMSEDGKTTCDVNTQNFFNAVPNDPIGWDEEEENW